MQTDGLTLLVTRDRLLNFAWPRYPIHYTTYWIPYISWDNWILYVLRQWILKQELSLQICKKVLLDSILCIYAVYVPRGKVCRILYLEN